MFEKEILIEKFTDFLPAHMLNFENHTVRSFCLKCEDITGFNSYLDNEDYNFLGITTPPYNPYGEEFNYAVVFEDIKDDYKILWHHCSRRWINQMRECLGCKKI